MKLRLLAGIWALIVLLALGHLAWQFKLGLSFDTNFLALVPQEEPDPGLAQAKMELEGRYARRMAFLLGHADREKARQAAETLAERLSKSGLLEEVTLRLAEDGLRALGDLYFPHRATLLAPEDRAALLQGDGADLRDRALAQIFGVGGFANGNLLRQDPFLLLPSFLMSLPRPGSGLRLVDGYAMGESAGAHFVLITARAGGEAFSLRDQQALARVLIEAEADLKARHGQIELLRTGAVLYAEAGGRRGLDEASRLGAFSIAGAIALFLLVFRGLRELLLGLLSIAVGLAFGLSVSLLLFEKLHAIAILFGASLIGVSVDYCLHYFTSAFDADAGSKTDRIRRLLPGLALGLATSLAGYAMLFLAPLPGLHQVAAFSCFGLIGAFLTVLLWLPSLERARRPGHGESLLRLAAAPWSFWRNANLRPLRILLVLAILGVAGFGATEIRVNDDVRALQSLDPGLQRQEAAIRRLTGSAIAGQYFLIRAANGEAALQSAEALADRLEPLVADGALGRFLSAASFAPSLARQEENRRLVEAKLIRPHLGELKALTGLGQAAPVETRPPAPLSLGAVAALNPLLAGLLLDPDGATQVVALENIRDPARVAAAAAGLADVRFVDPAAEISGLFGLYRERALWLSAVSALAMLLLLIPRYGVKSAGRVMLPPSLALVATPPLLALIGLPFTFFAAMALVLVLAIGVDYALFCRETRPGHEASTMLAIFLAGATTLISFGLLALSEIAAVQGFGAAMLIGIALAVLLSPLAGRQRGPEDRP